MGRDAGQSWDKILDLRFPITALGLDPDNASVRKGIRQRGGLQAVIVGIAFGLPTDALRSAASVRSELVWRVLRSALADVVGRGPFPLIHKSNAVDRIILCGLAGARAKSTPQAIAALAAKAIGTSKTDADRLRRRLIEIALKKSEPTVALDGFAERVKAVARSLSTPPFQGRVAIAQVYDAFGRAHPDAGSLNSFKERLVAAAKSRSLDLSRLDMPELMSGELRNRSKTRWGSDEVHFIVTEWK